MSSNSDFARPVGIEEGVLLNSNNKALLAYKKAKKRMNSVNSLEERVKELEENYNKLVELLGTIKNG